MISRKTTKILAEVYNMLFLSRKTGRNGVYYSVRREELYDYLFERDYDSWFCGRARKAYAHHKKTEREVKDFIMQLHTGEEFYEVTLEWDWSQRKKLGQRLLVNLAEDVLNYYPTLEDWKRNSLNEAFDQLKRSLELDGYVHQNGQLLIPESDVLDVEAEAGLLKSLYLSLSLDDVKTTFHHLELSEQDYLDNKWDNAISNARKFLENVLRGVASAHSKKRNGIMLPETTQKRPVEVRNYLERENLLIKKEREALDKVYGLLSETGGHPYMAKSDQARLLRHLALTFSQFVMLRLQGALSGGNTP